MLREGTVFVLGAAVSHEVGLPLGNKLKTDVASMLPTRSSGGSDELRYQLLHGNVDAVLAACDVIRRALPLAASIDNLVEHLGGNALLEQVAKAGIAGAILAHERRCDVAFKSDTFDFRSNVAETSYGDLFKLIVGRVPVSGLADALQRVKFINFNYDRCLEQFLYGALIAYSGLSPTKAADIVSKIIILHPYGDLGPLGWTSQDGSVAFGAPDNRTDFLRMASRIKTFSEEIGTDEHLAITDTIHNAETLIVLGCAHHPQNLRLLKPQNGLAGSEVYATMYAPAPPDPLGNASPSMDEFIRPAAEELARVFESWRASGYLGVSILPLTSRQLIARFGSAWSEPAA